MKEPRTKRQQLFLDVTCRFMNLKMRSMVFEDSLFEECYFEDITSSNTFFKNCTFIATLFYNTGRTDKLSAAARD